MIAIRGDDMRRSLGLILGLLGALALFACGGHDKEPSKPKTGGVKVVVQNVTSNAVRKVVVDLTPHGDPTGKSYRFNLSKDGKTWHAFAKKIYVGSYVVVARAFDREDANPDSVKPIFKSHPVIVDIPHNGVAKVYLLLHEETKPGKERLPTFVSVVLSKETIEQWETLRIDVEGKGSNRPLELSGFAAPGTPGHLRGVFSGSTDFVFTTGSDIGSASLTWKPPAYEGPRQLYLQIVDSRGNIAEMGIWVNVGKNVGALDVHAAFNLAPVVDLRPLVRNDDNGTTVLLWLFVEDDRSRVDEGEIGYEWSTTCNGTFITTGGYAPGEGTYVEEPTDLGPPGTSFRFQITPANLPPGNECEMELTVTDYEEDEYGNLVAGASRVVQLTIDTELLTPQTP